jgi:glycine C-acetyltransferase/8-amino-7-oxononanoate synthase
LIDYLINVARPFIFSTAPAPPVVAAAAAALELLEENPRRVERLQSNARAMREAMLAEGLEVGESETQILPVVVGDPELTVRLCEMALERGIFAQGIRPPTVPEGTSRLRLTTMATHRPAELLRAAKVIGNAADELGLLGEPEPVRELTPRLEKAA